MKPLTELSAFYQKRFAYHSQPLLKDEVSSALKVSVAIPAYKEDMHATFDSLGKCTLKNPESVEMILVINYPENAGPQEREYHHEQAERWSAAKLPNGIEVKVIRAFELPKKHAGVGLARKIAMDEALQRFSTIDQDGLIVCLDGDCTVSENYLQELLRLSDEHSNGYSFHFEHPFDGMKPEEQERIINYEIWLRYYSQALQFCGFPYYHHTIGSSMAIRASAYARIGGMNKRKAGEDFYFLHKLMPQGKFYSSGNLTVYPEARVSERVPFGTGRAMLEMEEGNKTFREVYHPAIFKLLKSWRPLQEEAGKWPAVIQQAFENFGWAQELQELQKRSSSRSQLQRNFYFWWDGFKMLKLVHYLRDEHFGVCDSADAVEELFGMKSGSRREILMQLRQLDRERE